MERKKILIFSGAGLDKESGISTFRDAGGLWYEYKVEEVASKKGWKMNKAKVLEFYNQRRRELKTVEPNDAHKIIAFLEKNFDVTNVTQNVSNLLERAGSSKVIHLHGELTKARSTFDENIILNWEDDLNIGDKCRKGSQLRPHIVFFEEMLNTNDLKKSSEAAIQADICIVVGTSMQVSPANTIPFLTKENAIIYYIDPSDMDFYIPSFRRPFFYHIKEVATTGMEYVYNDLIKIYNINE